MIHVVLHGVEVVLIFLVVAWVQQLERRVSDLDFPQFDDDADDQEAA